jgi:hypothetical protein
LQCGQMRTATAHLSVRTPNNKPSHRWKKRNSKGIRPHSLVKGKQAHLSLPFAGDRSRPVRPQRDATRHRPITVR